ncbi:hypothetical protein Tco_0728862 [Tanacetum coccineum]|uniref:CCHC-type domain-containing protein n=1 Tax=Tanacetum coccineum TaxID=301880 RepID=A0ABQ4YNF1_9ASTR
MASLDRRSNPLYAIKECSSCGNLHTKDCGCPKGSLEDKILVPIPDLSQRPLKIEKICLDCGDPVHGLYCRQCALIRKALEEVFQDFQDTSKSSNDDTNFVNQEPFIDKQGPGVNSSQSPPQINHNCCYECGDSLDDIFCQRCTCKSCGKGAHYGYNCPPQIPIISNPEPCYNQNLNEIPQNLQSLQQQCLFDYYHEQNPCYDSNSFGFDQFQPPQYTVNHPIFNDQNDLLNSQNELLNFQNKLMEQMTSLCDMVGQCLQKKEEEKRIEEEQAAKDRYWKIPVCYDDDDDEEKALDIPETESDEFIKSSVENLVQNPSESEDECECDVPDCDDSQTTNFSTFSNPLFDDSTSSDDESSHEEVIHEMSFKTYSNPLFDLDEEIISSEFNPIHNEDLDSTPKDVRFDAESYLLESLVNRDTLMASPPKIDFLLDEFAGELTRLQSIPPGIDNINLDPEGDILFLESLLYDNSSPRPPKAFQDNSNTIIESLPTFPIPVEDSDSLREEIDIFPGPDDSIPPGIESDDFDSEDDNNSTSLPEFDSFHVDYPDSGDSTINVVEDILVDVPNILPTHPALQLDFGFIPSHNDLGSNLDKSSPSGDRNKIYDPRIYIEVESTRFLAPLSLVIDTLLPFSSKNEDKVFNHGVLAYKEKYPPSSSHRGLKALQLPPESLILIHGDNTPNMGGVLAYKEKYPPSSSPFLSPLTSSSMGGSGQSQ